MVDVTALHELTKSHPAHIVITVSKKGVELTGRIISLCGFGQYSDGVAVGYDAVLILKDYGATSLKFELYVHPEADTQNVISWLKGNELLYWQGPKQLGFWDSP